MHWAWLCPPLKGEKKILLCAPWPCRNPLIFSHIAVKNKVSSCLHPHSESAIRDHHQRMVRTCLFLFLPFVIIFIVNYLIWLLLLPLQGRNTSKHPFGPSLHLRSSSHQLKGRAIGWGYDGWHLADPSRKHLVWFVFSPVKMWAGPFSPSERTRW